MTPKFWLWRGGLVFANALARDTHWRLSGGAKGRWSGNLRLFIASCRRAKMLQSRDGSLTIDAVQNGPDDRGSRRMNEMSLAAVAPKQGVLKDLYQIGEIPPLGHVPASMYAWAIRRDREGPADTAMQVEVVPTWPLDSHEVLVLVMAAGVNYNGVWASLGKPVSMFDGHKNPYHIAGSDASGIVWAVGSKVKRWKVGDEVVIHCNQDDGDDEECNGGDPMFSTSQRIWGYETPDG